MQPESFWKTRTINEAQLLGYSFVRLTCVCGRDTDFPFTLLLQRNGGTRHSFLGNIAFKCKQCGGKEPNIGVHSQTKAPGYFMRKSPHDGA